MSGTRYSISRAYYMFLLQEFGTYEKVLEYLNSISGFMLPIVELNVA